MRNRQRFLKGVSRGTLSHAAQSEAASTLFRARERQITVPVTIFDALQFPKQTNKSAVLTNRWKTEKRRRTCRKAMQECMKWLSSPLERERDKGRGGRKGKHTQKKGFNEKQEKNDKEGLWRFSNNIFIIFLCVTD